MLPQTSLCAMFFLQGLLLTWLSIPLIHDRVPRNAWYGFRVPKTLESDEIWYPANRYMGRELMRCGRIIAVGSVVLLFLSDRFSLDTVAWLGLAIALVPLSISLIRGFAYLRTL